jgi:hypothetical protein
MIFAAIVGIGASFAMQGVMPQEVAADKEQAPTAVGTDVLRSDMAGFEQRTQAQMNELTATVDSLGAQLQTLKKELQEFRAEMRAGGAVAPLAAGAEGQPAVTGSLDSAINRVLDDREQRRDDERQADREQRTAEMRERMQSAMTSRIDQTAQEKGWNLATTDQVKQIMNDYMEKTRELFSQGGGRRGRPDSGSFDQMRQLRDEARTKLLQLVSEEEADQLLGGAGMFGGRGDRGGRQPGGRQGGGRGGR